MEPTSKFELLVKQNELTRNVAFQLQKVLSMCDVVLLCDDSGSMVEPILEPGSNKQTTRWLELKKLAAVIIEFVTAINPNGLDIYFFHRPNLTGVTNMSGLQGVFNDPPKGNTPLLKTLRRIFGEKSKLADDRQLLVVVITDGEPSDGTLNDLFNCLYNKPTNVHVSLAECTDNEEEMEFLDEFDGKIPNFDNTDDYREELAKVKRIQGSAFKFDYTDYVIKILLASFVRWYFNLDQKNVQSKQVIYERNNSGAKNKSTSSCCVVL
jgi:hypothetical protein